MLKNRVVDVNIILPTPSRGLLNDAEVITLAIQNSSIACRVKNIRVISKLNGKISLIKQLGSIIYSSVYKVQINFHLEEFQPYFFNP